MRDPRQDDRVQVVDVIFLVGSSPKTESLIQGPRNPLNLVL